ncbi:DUF4124 domain-containing protein [Marinobacter sp. CHS3-4]|uniref:DUF4124 domain-containing protein n=1 Tax=Marinobacter sp. CHS3-4 TaxID=3045174 RepID=UPI0024B5E5E5|nr:DUF4124 domain-containing protein [Marinobacter sp. CHS3-4]MDI9244442.1 DUF4124 domain-containing protein [Marinobacter sp. CHS3-4]
MPGRHLVFLCLTVMVQTAGAEMYTWTDSLGTIHYSDTPPTAHDYQPVSLGRSSTVPMSSNIEVGKKVGAIHRQIEKAMEQDPPSVPTGRAVRSAVDQKQCDKLREQLNRIQQQLRAGYSNDRGNSLRRQRRKLSQRHSRDCMLG